MICYLGATEYAKEPSTLALLAPGHRAALHRVPLLYSVRRVGVTVVLHEVPVAEVLKRNV